MKSQKIALLEPFMTGSHQKWAQGLAKFSQHSIDLYGLPGRFWKWRMHGGAISLAQKILASNKEYDVFLGSDFLDLALFKSLVGSKYPKAKYYIYFHENQICYPWSPTDQDVQLKRDRHYGFINYSSALVADKVFFNSDFHKEIFLASLPAFLRQFPDNHNLETIDFIKQKSQTLPLALELPTLPANLSKIPNSILWNHRWEYDKNPEAFFNTLKSIKNLGIPFQLIVLGEQTQKYPAIFDWAKEVFKEEIIHFGYAESSAAYWSWLQKASILPVTSNQDFFGISIIEAMHANVYPILPNRLAYPSHIPPKYHKNHLYQSEQDLEQQLIELLTKDPIFSESSTWIQKYTWQHSIRQYDLALS